MADLISWMRDYNQTAAAGEDLRFYGNDMQRQSYNGQYLIEGAEAAHVETVCLLINQNAQAKHHVNVGLDAEDFYRIKDSRKE